MGKKNEQQEFLRLHSGPLAYSLGLSESRKGHWSSVIGHSSLVKHYGSLGLGALVVRKMNHQDTKPAQRCWLLIGKSLVFQQDFRRSTTDDQ
ncbi:MAG TPA: hypothetical protein VGK99_06905 [Acidobacteriota bacterium]|jgi:hypothetical protein